MLDRDDFAAIILAAGSSSRLGRPKQTVLLNEETLLDRAVRTARDGGASDVIVVLGAFADDVQAACQLHDCRIVRNAGWQTGMGSSIRTGIEAVQGKSGAVLLTCDMPYVSAAHLRALTRSGNLTASGYASAKGIPAYFPASYFAELRQLEGNATAKHLLRTADEVELNGGEMDVDTEEDVRAIMAR